MDTLFFLTSKLVWALIRPESILLLLFAVGLFALRRKRMRTARVFLGASFACFVAIAILPIGNLLLVPLESRFKSNPELSNIAGVIILGGAENEVVSRVWDVPTVSEAGDRFLAGIKLANEFPEAKILFTGGSGKIISGGADNAGVARQIFANSGIAESRIILEGKSRTTAENAGNTFDLIGDDGPGNWVLVTSAFHMPRAVGTFCKAGWVNFIAYPVDHRTTGFASGIGWNLAGNLETLNIAVKEWVGLLAYRLAGKTDFLFPSGC
jgi:uncharacterized SAM-binding protein YcdF (DUF218 family)